MGKITRNTLYYGDNLNILRQYIDDESIDLIYLDPPFNSNRSYNVLFKDESGSDSEAQLTAFDDSWHWGDPAEETYYELVNNSSPEIATMIGALRQFIGTNQMMAYLVMMTIRLLELHRVLKNSGSIYLHCDPTASHYLKIILDTIFKAENFLNEIIWQRFDFHADAKRWGRLHDTIIVYSKDKNNFVFYKQRKPYGKKFIDSHFKEDENGRLYTLSDALGKGQGPARVFFGKIIEPTKDTHWRFSQEKIDAMISQGKIVLTENERPRIKRYLDEMKGQVIGDVWTDIPLINSQAKERLGYPTQKPESLLERIIKASCQEGDLILDPFSGCGTAIAVAQKFNRKWIGIDITYLAIALHKNRLKEMFGLEPKRDYEIIGEPQSLHDAIQLSQDNRFQFEWWALSLIEARPAGDKKKGSDKGIDGIIIFSDEAKANVKQILVQVKSGHVNSGLIRDFRGTIERESNAVMGIFISLEKPTRDMETEALEAGYYVSPFTDQKYRKIQIYTIKELLSGKEPDLPQVATFRTFRKADKVKKDKDAKQEKLDI